MKHSIIAALILGLVFSPNVPAASPSSEDIRKAIDGAPTGYAVLAFSPEMVVRVLDSVPASVPLLSLRVSRLPRSEMLIFRPGALELFLSP